MNKNNYNYILNGITHEISLNSTIKIRIDPIKEEQLISNKFMIKFVSDLFDYHNIDYFLLGDTLLGVKIFSGINLFSNKIELGIIKNNLIKLQKLEQYLIDNDFSIYYFDNFILIKSIFFNKIEITAIIYLLENEKKLYLKNENNEFIFFDFYEIFPLNKVNFEEFTIYIPNKIDAVLNCFNINFKSIIFNKIIDFNFENLLFTQEKIVNNKQENVKNIINKMNNNININDKEDKDDIEEIYINKEQEILNIDNMINNIINKNIKQKDEQQDEYQVEQQDEYQVEQQVEQQDEQQDEYQDEQQVEQQVEQQDEQQDEYQYIEQDEYQYIEQNEYQVEQQVEQQIQDINKYENIIINKLELDIQEKTVYQQEIYISIILVIIIIFDYQIQFHEEI